MPNGRLTNNRTTNAALYRDLRASPGAAYFPAPIEREQALDVARGAVTAPFTLGPDIAGLAQQGYGWLEDRARGALERRGLPFLSPLADVPEISGDPIREAVGLDPQSGAGMLGEMLDPTAAVAKAGKLLANYGPEMARYIGDPALAMTLFHGTPHKFNRFSLDAIGTGEGAQAFGHGLYFAESPGVARSYRDTLSSGPLDPETVIFNAEEFGGDAKRALNDMADNRNLYDWTDAQAESVRSIANDPDLTAAMISANKGDYDGLNAVFSRHGMGGHLYEVEIPDEVTDRMLDWHKPLSEQPENVKESIAKLLADNPEKSALQAVERYDMTGDHIYDRIVGQLAGRNTGGQEAASRILQEQGIPGIKYRAGSLSGGAGDTDNIVLFDPEDITQVKRDSELVFEAEDLRKGRLADAGESLDTDYRITHTAPLREGSNTLDAPADIWGDDIYNPQAWNWFGHGGDSVAIDKQSANIISRFRGKPDADVTIYRAVPKGTKTINPGDWVTINRNYAAEHGYRHVGDDYEIISKKVKAQDIATDGNSIHEWGYDPQ